MAAVLGANIVLMSDDGYTPVTFLAGTPKVDLPEWALERITNPDVWVDAPKGAKASDDGGDGPSPLPQEASSTSAAEEVAEDEPGEEQPADPRTASSTSAAEKVDASDPEPPADNEDSTPAPAEKPRRRRS